MDEVERCNEYCQTFSMSSAVTESFLTMNICHIIVARPGVNITMDVLMKYTQFYTYNSKQSAEAPTVLIKTDSPV